MANSQYVRWSSRLMVSLCLLMAVSCAGALALKCLHFFALCVNQAIFSPKTKYIYGYEHLTDAL